MTIQPREMLCPTSNWPNKCPYKMTAEAITVHNTANDASANNEIAYMNRNTNQVSFHFAIDDTEVVQGLPLDRNGWHSGDGANGYGNRKTIGIEICYSKSGGKKFDKAEQLAAKFIAQLLYERKWGIDRVGTHQMRSGKYCPHRTLDYGWDRFLKMVSNELEALKLKWVPMEEPREMVTKDGARLYDLPSLNVVKTYKAGEKIFWNTKTTYDGVLFLRSDWSTERNLDRGMPFDDLEEIPKPEPQPEPTPEPEPTPDDGDDTPNWFIRFIKALGEFLVNLFTKKEK